MGPAIIIFRRMFLIQKLETILPKISSMTVSEGQKSHVKYLFFSPTLLSLHDFLFLLIFFSFSKSSSYIWQSQQVNSHCLNLTLLFSQQHLQSTGHLQCLNSTTKVPVELEFGFCSPTGFYVFPEKMGKIIFYISSGCDIFGRDLA